MTIKHPTPADIPQLRQLWQQAFGDEDNFLDLFFDTAFSPERSMCLFAGDTCAAALYWFDCSYPHGKLAYIYAVATHPNHREQGLCRQLMAQTHQLLTRRGYAGTVLVPGEPGLFAMYAKMGYAPFSGMDNLTVSAGEPTPLQELTPKAYAEQRRQLLPINGVVQEGENLTFFSRFARFYAGRNFVFAAAEQGSSLTVFEFLGDTSCLSGIPAALHKESCTVRIPGSDAFAMYHPLTASPAPGYFGLAFD